MEELKALAAEKEKIENEIMELKKKIDEIEEAEGYNKGLVDSEGFPKPDLDFGKLTEYKLMKRRFNELQTDHKALMKKVEEGLFALHQHYRETGLADKELEEYEKNKEKQKELERKQKEIMERNEQLKKMAEEKKAAAEKKVPIPFCSITAVIDNSPAYVGGIRLNDLICQFGSLNHSNFTEVGQLAGIVKLNVNHPINYELLRKADMNNTEGETYTYKGEPYIRIEGTVTPRKWEGEGVLGCRFAALK